MVDKSVAIWMIRGQNFVDHREAIWRDLNRLKEFENRSEVWSSQATSAQVDDRRECNHLDDPWFKFGRPSEEPT